MDAQLERAMYHAGVLAVRLTDGHAVDLSDAEIDRCMRVTVAPPVCVALTRVLRDAGMLVRDGNEWVVRSD